VANAFYKSTRKENRFFTEKARIPPPKKKLDSERTAKELLNKLSLEKLKDLAKKHGVVLKPTVEKGLFEERKVEPTKYQYVEKLQDVVPAEELRNLLAVVFEDKKSAKKVRRQSNNPW
jgi:hypothetical protein